MKLVEIIGAHIYRDGGSYEVNFSTDENRVYSVFLKSSQIPISDGLRHRWLYEYEGVELPEHIIPVVNGSNQEQQIIARLTSFLDLNEESKDQESNENHNENLYLLRKLLHYIPLRQPCFPYDIR